MIRCEGFTCVPEKRACPVLPTPRPHRPVVIHCPATLAIAELNRMRFRSCLFVCAAFVVVAGCARPDILPYDLLIADARVVDGTGAPWYRADIAVHGGVARRRGPA